MKINIDDYKNKIYHGDCLEFMKNLPDNYFDLCLTDPPYGINILNNGKIGYAKLAKTCDYSYANNNWDAWKPTKEYMNEIFRVSKNQIIFGANHFIESMPINSPCWLVWNKENGLTDFADCELAWTSFKTAVRIIRYQWHGMIQADMRNKEIRVHPTQKPVKLFTAILQSYASQKNTIFDPFMGSGTTALAASALSLEWYGCELDSVYIQKANERLKIIQPDIFGMTINETVK